MERRIIHIDREKCNGCGACAAACHEGAIGMREGKAVLLRDDYCDGLGDCLPACPAGAITFTEREAAAYDAAAVAARKAAGDAPHAGCPGTAARTFEAHAGCPGSAVKTFSDTDDIPAAAPADAGQPSRLRQWPVQIKLVPERAPWLDGARLLVAADCSAYAFGAFHERFMKNRITLIGCPKLDGVDYSEKLTRILAQNDIAELLIVRMEVPCCGGLEAAAKRALQASGKFIPWQVVTLSAEGRILD